MQNIDSCKMQNNKSKYRFASNDPNRKNQLSPSSLSEWHTLTLLQKTAYRNTLWHNYLLGNFRNPFYLQFEGYRNQNDINCLHKKWIRRQLARKSTKLNEFRRIDFTVYEQYGRPNSALCLFIYLQKKVFTFQSTHITFMTSNHFSKNLVLLSEPHDSYDFEGATLRLFGHWKISTLHFPNESRIARTSHSTAPTFTRLCVCVFVRELQLKRMKKWFVYESISPLYEVRNTKTKCRRLN